MALECGLGRVEPLDGLVFRVRPNGTDFAGFVPEALSRLDGGAGAIVTLLE